MNISRDKGRLITIGKKEQKAVLLDWGLNVINDGSVTVGIVEFSDGTVKRVHLSEIRFVDNVDKLLDDERRGIST